MFTGSFPPTTNAQDWTVSFALTDSQSDEPFDLSDVTEIEIVVRDPDSKSSVLEGSLTDETIIFTDGTPHTVTMTIASPAVVSFTDHGHVADDIVIFDTSGALPTGITAGEIYYLISAGLTDDAFEISASLGGSAVTTTGSQSGTHTAQFGQVGTFQWTFAESEMSDLCAKVYEVGVRLTHSDGAITQIINGKLPVIDGLFE